MQRDIPESLLAHAFAAVPGMAILVPPDKRVQLAAFSQPGLSDADYRRFDLPLKVGQMNAAQREVFMPNEDLGRYEYKNMLVVENYAAMKPEDFRRVALALTGSDDAVLVGSRHDKLTTRPREQDAALIDAIVARQIAQAPLVADILRLDQTAMGGGKMVIDYEFVQDRPSPAQALAPYMHADGPSIPGVLHRSFLTRSKTPPQFIRDQIVGHPLAQDPVYRAIARGEPVAPQYLDPWVERAKQAGMVVEPEPGDIMLMSRQKTQHRSRWPQKAADVVTSSYMRVMVAPCPY